MILICCFACIDERKKSFAANQTTQEMKDKKIGWIGTGLMGSTMVKHLLKAG